ncbi:hypothetical protein H6F99_20550 [Aphanizomenon flos-aquae FACHB-1040]|uniref:Uncharacterized protein n=1 Tax=Aphanizomenon flos-aquae FACHB-1040 TaxID=2692887 RepID=A0ABR8C1D7_APHFL|nr:hypothetical protein [Aphanizomenon flos-aquae FACHB-1040]
MQQRFAIAPPHLKSDSCGALRYRTPNIPKRELLAAALRYRTPTSQKRSP